MHNETTPPLSAWTSILSISTRYQMKRVRTRAIKEIFDFWPRIDPVDQVVLAVKHNVPDWLPLAYAVLCQRDDPIEIDEAKKLGLETTVMLAKAREIVRRTADAENGAVLKDSRGPTGSGKRPCRSDATPFSAPLVNHVINEIFWPKPAKQEKTVLPSGSEFVPDASPALEKADKVELATDVNVKSPGTSLGLPDDPSYGFASDPPEVSQWYRFCLQKTDALSDTDQLHRFQVQHSFGSR
jgi:hypothetical protein